MFTESTLVSRGQKIGVFSGHDLSLVIVPHPEETRSDLVYAQEPLLLALFFFRGREEKLSVKLFHITTRHQKNQV